MTRLLLETLAATAFGLWCYWTGRLHAEGGTWAKFLRENFEILCEDDPEILRPWARWIARIIQGRKRGRKP